jgi:hypothetical protein
MKLAAANGRGICIELSFIRNSTSAEKLRRSRKRRVFTHAHGFSGIVRLENFIS